MFWLVRCAIIIGAIMYLSPARQERGETNPAGSKPDRSPSETLGNLWRDVPEKARRPLEEALARKAVEATLGSLHDEVPEGTTPRGLAPRSDRRPPPGNSRADPLLHRN